MGRTVVAYVIVVALGACGKRASYDEPPPPIDRGAIYPLIVPANELPSGPVRRVLIDGLVVTLAAEMHGADQPAGQAKLLREPDLQGMTLDEAYTVALANLEAAARRGEIPVKAELRAGAPIDVVWGHDWRAAACLLLPGVRQQAVQQLVPASGSVSAAGGSAAATAGSASAPSPSVYALIPNRDVLVWFADPALAPTVLAAEKRSPRTISEHVLRLVPSDQPFWIKAPVAWQP